MPFKEQSRFVVQRKGRCTTPVVIFIGHLFDSSGGAAFLRQQQLCPTSQPIYAGGGSTQGAFHEKDTHPGSSQQDAAHPPSVSFVGASGAHRMSAPARTSPERGSEESIATLQLFIVAQTNAKPTPANMRSSLMAPRRKNLVRTALS